MKCKECKECIQNEPQSLFLESCRHRAIIDIWTCPHLPICMAIQKYGPIHVEGNQPLTITKGAQREITKEIALNKLIRKRR